MMNNFIFKLKKILMICKFDIIYYFLCERIYVNKVAVTVEKDLSSLLPVQDALEKAGVNLVPITPGSLVQNTTAQQTLIYPDEKRLKKAVWYLNKGYHGVALVRGKEVSGDIWYAGARDGREPIHPDLKWLRINLTDNDAYAFDLYLHPDKRGKNLANLLQYGALQHIRNKGYARALGYYWLKNIPALWVHRTLQWKQLGKVKVFRFLFIRHSQSLDLPMQGKSSVNTI